MIPSDRNTDLVEFITTLENIRVEPDQVARIIINERTGTVVSGGDVRIDNVTLSHGDIKVVISTDYSVSQPLLVRTESDGIRTAVIPDTDIQVKERSAGAVNIRGGATIADLITALQRK